MGDGEHCKWRVGDVGVVEVGEVALGAKPIEVKVIIVGRKWVHVDSCVPESPYGLFPRRFRFDGTSADARWGMRLYTLSAHASLMRRRAQVSALRQQGVEVGRCVDDGVVESIHRVVFGGEEDGR